MASQSPDELAMRKRLYKNKWIIVYEDMENQILTRFGIGRDEFRYALDLYEEDEFLVGNKKSVENISKRFKKCKYPEMTVSE